MNKATHRGAIAPSISVALIAAVAAMILGSCSGTGGDEAAAAYEHCLYMTDTVSGRVYAYDPETQSAASSSFATTGKNATGEIGFYKGIGYAAVGSGSDKGLYYFNPSATNPAFSKLGQGIAAQYFAFSSSTAAFVSSFDYSGTTSGLYSFNPSNPSAGLSAVASLGGKYLQELAIGADGYLYAADNGNGAVLKIDMASGAILATIAASAKGTTGLSKGSFGGVNGIFVANTGGYDSSYSPLPGSIDFISGGGGITAVAKASSSGASIYPARVLQLDSGDIAATGYNHSYLVKLSGTSASVAELKNASGSGFGGLDIASKEALLYIPVAVTSDYISYKNYLYVIDSNGAQKSYSPVSVMGSSDGLSNIGFYEN